MGQQQLILILLVTVIAAIMTVVAINTMSDARVRSVDDAVRGDILKAATEANAYYTKHAMLGGGGQSFLNISLTDISLDTLNENARYTITNRAMGSFQITAQTNGGSPTLIADITPGNVAWQ